MSIHDRRALPHFRPLHKMYMGAPGQHPRIDTTVPAISTQAAKDRFVNLLVSALLELLSAAPAIGADFETAVTSWHNAHGDQAKTAAAVSTATQIIAAAGALATTLEPAPPSPLETNTTGH